MNGVSEKVASNAQVLGSDTCERRNQCSGGELVWPQSGDRTAFSASPRSVCLVLNLRSSLLQCRSLCNIKLVRKFALRM